VLKLRILNASIAAFLILGLVGSVKSQEWPPKGKGPATVINPALTTAYQGGNQCGRGPEKRLLSCSVPVLAIYRPHVVACT
jgi:hypothetical protein